VGAWLARDAGDVMYQKDRIIVIAGKLERDPHAPTDTAQIVGSIL
jgi:hypothetical protein